MPYITVSMIFQQSFGLYLSNELCMDRNGEKPDESQEERAEPADQGLTRVLITGYQAPIRGLARQCILGLSCSLNVSACLKELGVPATDSTDLPSFSRFEQSRPSGPLCFPEDQTQGEQCAGQLRQGNIFRRRPGGSPGSRLRLAGR